MNKKILLIAGAIVALVVLGLFALSFIGGAEQEGGSTVPISTERALSDSDKQEIDQKAQDFIAAVGNYGWYPELIRDPNLSADDLSYANLYKQEYVAVEDVQAQLRALTNSTKFDSLVNRAAYETPFSVESTHDELVVPDYPVAVGEDTFVEMVVPLSSTVSYVSNSVSYVDESGTLHDSETSVVVSVYEGELTLRFIRSGGSWFVDSFESTIGVLAVDDFFIFNGDLVTETKPVENSIYRVSS